MRLAGDEELIFELERLAVETVDLLEAVEVELSVKGPPVRQFEGSGHHHIHKSLVVGDDQTHALLAPSEDVLCLWVVQLIPKLANEFVHSPDGSWLDWCVGLLQVFFDHLTLKIIKHNIVT